MQGRDAEAALQRLCANDVAVPVGSTVYTGLLNARGTYESDLTVARLAPDRFLLVTGTAQTTRDADWIRRNQPEGANATLTDVSSAYAVIAVMGPRARDLLVAAHQDAARQRGVSVRHDPRDRLRLRDRARLAPHLCGRAWLGALCSGRIRGRRL